MTAFYMFRLMYLTFLGKPAHEPRGRAPHSRIARIDDRAAGRARALSQSLPDGWAGRTASAVPTASRSSLSRSSLLKLKCFRRKAEPPKLRPERKRKNTTPVGIAADGLSLAAAGVGWGLAQRAYGHADKGYTEPIARSPRPSTTLFSINITWTKPTTTVFTGRRKVGDVRLGVLGLGEASAWFDTNVVDGAVNGAGWITRLTATISSWWDKWIIDGMVSTAPQFWRVCCRIPRACSSGVWSSGTRLVMTAGLVGFVFYYVYH